MLPMLTLGIPGSPTTAILLGGMVIWGLTPGPRLFVEQSEFVWGLIGSFYVSNLAALVINLAFIPLFIWMLRMPFTVLAPLIFVLSVVGGYAATKDMHDVWLMIMFGSQRVLPAQVRLSAGTGGSGHRAGSDCRADIASVAVAVVGRSVDLLHAADCGSDHGRSRSSFCSCR